jgi:hypothetical protein
MNKSKFITDKLYLVVFFILCLCQIKIACADDFRKVSKLPKCIVSADIITPNDVANWNNCWGTYEYREKNGEKILFDGEFKSGRLNGKGRIYFFGKGEILPAGLMYIGEFNDGKYHGVGTYIHKGDESTYGKRVGHFKNGRFDGLGVEYSSDGTILSEGVWENDILIKELKTEFSK